MLIRPSMPKLEKTNILLPVQIPGFTAQEPDAQRGQVTYQRSQGNWQNFHLPAFSLFHSLPTLQESRGSQEILSKLPSLVPFPQPPRKPERSWCSPSAIWWLLLGMSPALLVWKSCHGILTLTWTPHPVPISADIRFTHANTHL